MAEDRAASPVTVLSVFRGVAGTAGAFTWGGLAFARSADVDRALVTAVRVGAREVTWGALATLAVLWVMTTPGEAGSAICRGVTDAEGTGRTLGTTGLTGGRGVSGVVAAVAGARAGAAGAEAGRGGGVAAFRGASGTVWSGLCTGGVTADTLPPGVMTHQDIRWPTSRMTTVSRAAMRQRATASFQYSFQYIEGPPRGVARGRYRSVGAGRMRSAPENRHLGSQVPPSPRRRGMNPVKHAENPEKAPAESAVRTRAAPRR
ncbi:hypothetical protein GCM10025871_26600 [Deinococcus metallilatus]|nr:hypothetical protein GCM10025871_26600 [Deinococcus metallilatus]